MKSSCIRLILRISFVLVLLFFTEFVILNKTCDKSNIKVCRLFFLFKKSFNALLTEVHLCNPTVLFKSLIVFQNNCNSCTPTQGNNYRCFEICSEAAENVTPTIGFSSVSFQFEKHDVILFDLGGGKNIRGIWKKYFAEVHGLIYVVDSSAVLRLRECREVLEKLIQEDMVKGKPLLL